MVGGGVEVGLMVMMMKELSMNRRRRNVGGLGLWFPVGFKERKKKKVEGRPLIVGEGKNAGPGKSTSCHPLGAGQGWATGLQYWAAGQRERTRKKKKKMTVHSLTPISTDYPSLSASGGVVF